MRFLLRLLFIALCASGARAAEPVTTFNVVLLQPSSVLEKRVPSVDVMADYIKAVQAALAEAVVESGSRQEVGGFVVLAVRPGRQSRVWLDFDTLIDLHLRKSIVDRVGAVHAFEATEGPVVFALKVAFWNGREPKKTVPFPPEWKAVEHGKPMEVGELVEQAWDK